MKKTGFVGRVSRILYLSPLGGLLSHCAHRLGVGFLAFSWPFQVADAFLASICLIELASIELGSKHLLGTDGKLVFWSYLWLKMDVGGPSILVEL